MRHWPGLGGVVAPVSFPNEILEFGLHGEGGRAAGRGGNRPPIRGDTASRDAPCVSECRKRNYSMKSSERDKAEGTAKKAVGSIKKAAGKATDNPKLEAKGRAQKGEGAVQKKAGDVKKVFGK